MIISLDTETTGVDFAHGAAPFLVTVCDDEDKVLFWEWDVDPLTRRPQVVEADLAEIAEVIEAADLIYIQNAKFDAHALRMIGLDLPWSKVRDTLAMGHLLASNQGHRLDELCLEYLNVDINRYEEAVEAVVKTARAIVKREYPDWRIAEEGLPDMPSVKASSDRDEDRPWKNDMWLPRALMKAGSRNYIPEHWATACAEYANADSSYTLPLGLEMERIIRERDLWAIYQHRLELPRVAYEMEACGLTAIGKYTEATIAEYERYVADAGATLTGIAAEYGHKLELAAGPSINDNMRDFLYGSIEQRCPVCKYRKRVKHWIGESPSADPCPKCANRKRKPARHSLVTTEGRNLALPVISRAHGGSKKAVAAALDKEAMQEYLTTTDGDAQDFIRILVDKRKHDTDLTYMRAYRRFWVKTETEDYFRIHPSLNPFATDHLRWGSNSPNCQNIGKQEDTCDECKGKDKECPWCGGSGRSRISVRYCFGPAPDREWWSMDFQNIELRIPAYESGEGKMIEIFERGEVEPYWGSYHNLISSIVYPEEYFADDLHLVKDGFKKLYKSTLYQWMKNFNFARIYGCGKAKGDRTARRSGACDMVDAGLPALAELQAYYLQYANKYGFVETLPDRTVDANRGYPILAGRTEDNRVLPTTPFNYHISGTACWAKNTALIRCSRQCAEWQREGFDARIPLEVHDELLFDFPRGKTPDENKPRAMILKRLMEQSGEDLVPRIPTPVNVSYHDETWAKELAV